MIEFLKITSANLVILKHELLTIQRMTAIPTNWIVLKRIFLALLTITMLVK